MYVGRRNNRGAAIPRRPFSLQLSRRPLYSRQCLHDRLTSQGPHHETGDQQDQEDQEKKDDEDQQQQQQQNKQGEEPKQQEDQPGQQNEQKSASKDGQSQKMSAEDAQRLLDQMADQERQNMHREARRLAMVEGKTPEKDW